MNAWKHEKKKTVGTYDLFKTKFFKLNENEFACSDFTWEIFSMKQMISFCTQTTSTTFSG